MDFHLSKIPKFIDNFDLIIEKYNYFLFDCDGVVWKEKEVLTKCTNMIKKILSCDKKIFFLTNANKFSREDLQERFKKLCEIEIGIEYIYPSSYLISRYIKENHPNITNIYVIGKDGLTKELEKQGFKIYGGEHDSNIKIIEDFNYDKMEEVEINNDIQACVVGADDKINFFKIYYAQQIVNDTGLFFGTNPDCHYKIGTRYGPGSYTFISAIETCTGRKATIVTKPNPLVIDIIIKEHNLNNHDKNKMVMIGDNIKTDIGFANNAKIDSILVFTGVTTIEDYDNIKTNDHMPQPSFLLKEF